MTKELLGVPGLPGVRATSDSERIHPGGNEWLLARLAQLPPGCAEWERVRAQVIAEKLPFAVGLARRYLGRGESYDDLRQVAAVGLVKAVNRYDAGRGVPFAAYATPTILGELRRHFRDCAWSLRVPRAVKEMRQELIQTSSDLTQRLRHEPRADEFAECVGVTKSQAREALVADAAYDTTSLSAPVVAGGVERQDLIGEADAQLEQIPDRVAVSSLLGRIPERERRILTLRFFGDMTQSEIGAQIGVSQMHVSRLLSAALGRLREALLAEPAGSPADGRRALLDVRRFSNERVVVSVFGRLDRDTAEQLRRVADTTVREAEPRLLVLDLAQTHSVDQSGAATLVYIHRICASVGARLRLSNVRRRVRPALEDAGLAPKAAARRSGVAAA